MFFFPFLIYDSGGGGAGGVSFFLFEKKGWGGGLLHFKKRLSMTISLIRIIPFYPSKFISQKKKKTQQEQKPPPRQNRLVPALPTAPSLSCAGVISRIARCMFLGSEVSCALAAVLASSHYRLEWR